MKCRRFFYENPEDTKFCGRCGLELREDGGPECAPTRIFPAPRFLQRGVAIALSAVAVVLAGSGCLSIKNPNRDSASGKQVVEMKEEDCGRIEGMIQKEGPKIRNNAMKTKILFVCYGNTCRSPMAEGLARKIMGDRVLAESAGISPSPAYGHAADDAVSVMKTVYGTDISGHKPRSVNKVDLSAFDYVIALDFNVYRALKEKRLVPEAKLFGWDIADPIGQGFGLYKQTARKIESRLIQFLENEGIVI